MIKTREEEITQKVERRYTVCDLCEKEIPDPVYTNSFSCPSEKPILDLFVGYVGNPSRFSTESQQRYGLHLGDVCRECRENWFKQLKEHFPNAREVKIND